MTEWVVEHCSSQPAEIDTISPGFLIQRQNIHEVKHAADKDNGNGEYSEWVCECRKISVAEYQLQHEEELKSLNDAVDDLTVAALGGES